MEGGGETGREMRGISGLKSLESQQKSHTITHNIHYSVQVATLYFLCHSVQFLVISNLTGSRMNLVIISQLSPLHTLQ
jgi:hypothetical protein